jgi:glycerol kinase
MGDQSAALVSGITAGEPEALVNLGTGGFVVCYLPQKRAAPDGYLQTLVWRDRNGSTFMACEGTLNSIAAALAPYPAGTCRIEDLGSDDIFCLAEPSGLGAPYFRGDLGVRFSAPVEHLPPQRIALLLQEGIVFRVARILDDLQSEVGIARAYLSGGLSGLPCLQQGIAQCVPLETFRLAQTEAGLAGAARLAAGVVSVRKAEPITATGDRRLAEKYRRWKGWLDGLLQQ